MPTEAVQIVGHAEVVRFFATVPADGRLDLIYEYAATVCEVPLDQMILVACHLWDIDGAARAGMPTAWINRTGLAYPAFFARPDTMASGIEDLADRLTA